MANLKPEISFYNQKEMEFMASHMSEWVLISEQKILGFFATFEKAAEKLTREFDPENADRPFLLRQIGAPKPVFNRMVPVSV